MGDGKVKMEIRTPFQGRVNGNTIQKSNLTPGYGSDTSKTYLLVSSEVENKHGRAHTEWSNIALAIAQTTRIEGVPARVALRREERK